ncbi:MAG: hypothetical protein H7039_07885 [Bryobacteraceae bacterium]|nr:hypothetical protein [Bryobacteraceae bacterium]
MFDGWWLPPAISRYAIEHDVQFVRTFAAAIFIAAHAALGFLTWRYRSRPLAEPEISTVTHGRAELL